MKLVWDASIGPAGRKLVALNLAEHCNDQGGSLFVSMLTIARECNLSRSQAQRYVRSLIEDGMLSVVANAGGGAPGTVPHYQLHLDRIAAKTGSTGAAPLAFGATKTDGMLATPTGSTDAQRPPVPQEPVKPETDSAGATGGMDATGSAHAQEGSHGCTGGVVPMRQTGSAHATQTTINHQLTINEPEGKRGRKPPTPRFNAGDIPLPDWLDRDLWKTWCRDRGSRRSISQETARLHLDKLTKLRAAGHEPELVIANAIEGSWQKFYEPKTGEQSRRAPPGRHRGFDQIDYRKEGNPDGSIPA